jgi:hypothetical protein
MTVLGQPYFYVYLYLEERGFLEDLEVDKTITLQCTLRNLDESADWIHLAQERVQWRIFLKTVMNVRSLINGDIS